MAAAPAAAVLENTGQKAVQGDVRVMVGRPGVQFVIPKMLVRYFGILNDVSSCSEQLCPVDPEVSTTIREHEGDYDGESKSTEQKEPMAWPLIEPGDLARIIEFYMIAASKPATTVDNTEKLSQEHKKKQQKREQYIFSLSDLITPGTKPGPKSDVQALIRLINGCNYLECEELLMVACAAAAAHIIGRTVFPKGFQPERREEKDKHWALFREQVSADAAFLIDRYLPFESEPLVPFEERRSFLTEHLAEASVYFLTPDELQKWPPFKLHSLAVDLQHMGWQRMHNCESLLKTTIITTFTQYDCVNLDRFLLHFVAQLYPQWTDVEEQMTTRHLDRQQYASAAAIANGFALRLSRKANHEAKAESENHPILGHQLAPELHLTLGYQLTNRFWEVVVAAERRGSSSGAEPLSFHVLPLLGNESAKAAFHPLMIHYVKHSDWQAILQVITSVPEMALVDRQSIVRRAAIRCKVHLAGQLASMLGCDVVWRDLLWGVMNGGDEAGQCLARYVLRLPNFWSSPTCREDLRHVIDVDVGSEAQRAMLMLQIQNRGWAAEFQAAYIEAEWISSNAEDQAAEAGAEVAEATAAVLAAAREEDAAVQSVLPIVPLSVVVRALE